MFQNLMPKVFTFPRGKVSSACKLRFPLPRWPLKGLLHQCGLGMLSHVADSFPASVPQPWTLVRPQRMASR